MTDAPTVSSDDPGLDLVEAELYRLDPTGDRVATVLRETFDQLYDGQHTGRWNFNDLHKTEKTHMGTLVEINLHREFDFEDGTETDYRIAGVQVDCKYSMKPFGWMLPPEVIDEIARLVTANDEASTWRAGHPARYSPNHAKHPEPRREDDVVTPRAPADPLAVDGASRISAEPVSSARLRDARCNLQRQVAERSARAGAGE